MKKFFEIKKLSFHRVIKINYSNTKSVIVHLTSKFGFSVKRDVFMDDPFTRVKIGFIVIQIG